MSASMEKWTLTCCVGQARCRSCMGSRKTRCAWETKVAAAQLSWTGMGKARGHGRLRHRASRPCSTPGAGSTAKAGRRSGKPRQAEGSAAPARPRRASKSSRARVRRLWPRTPTKKSAPRRAEKSRAGEKSRSDPLRCFQGKATLFFRPVWQPPGSGRSTYYRALAPAEADEAGARGEGGGGVLLGTANGCGHRQVAMAARRRT